MKKQLISQIMSIGPWGQLIWLNTTLGIIGVAVQSVGLVWLVYIIATGQWE